MEMFLIEQRNLNKGLHGDLVRVVTGKKNSKNKYEGKIVEVIERKKRGFCWGLSKKQRVCFCKYTKRKDVYRLFYNQRRDEGL
jgi:exoribonuclease R